ncbi:putative Rho-type GTPase-activating protein 2 [Beauveria bassiana]|nr:putative Rho-type GTPase-activating protein 2 [Beauveria bassiana]
MSQPAFTRGRLPAAAAAVTTTAPPSTDANVDVNTDVNTDVPLYSQSPRPAAPSPLSATQQYDPPATSKSREHSRGSPRKSGRHNQPAAQTTFYSDSSGPSSPDRAIANSQSVPNVSSVNRSVSQPLTSEKPTAAPGSSNLSMDAPVVAALARAMPAPRNSSLDTAISAMSTQRPDGSASSSAPQSHDIAHLIQTAGSPEAVIKYLLKEKQSQSQQNSQLWRLVDKQRAMILGLNKDLEAALKDKERYRRKLKEFINNPSVIRAAAGRVPQGGAQEPRPTPQVDVDTHNVMNPDSPVLESDSQKNSPVDLTMAPYPITPPADRPHQHQASATGVAEVLDPSRSMPKPREHALNNYDHEAEERVEEQARKQRGEETLREIPFNVQLPPSRSLPTESPKMPPSRSLPTEPPKMPPPRLPSRPESPSRKKESASKPAAPSRKGPPAPLQLPKGRPTQSSPPVGQGSDSESEYDDLLNVNKPDRHLIKGAAGDATLNPSSAEHAGTPDHDHRAATIPDINEPNPTQAASKGQGPEAATTSLAAVLNTERGQALAPPMPSPGLPMSPRPLKTSAQSPPHSPLSQMSLSPRPPRQPIPLPPNTPLATSSSASSTAPSQPLQDSPLNVPSIRQIDLDEKPPADAQASPTEHKQNLKGLATDEYPDLLLPPNALPSIDIKVASSRMKPSRASLLSLAQLEEDPVFTLAVISRADRGELWRVEKDTLSLSKLDQRMKQCQVFTAKTPEKSLFNGHSPAKLDARRQALEQYMDELLNTELDEATALELCKYLSTNAFAPNDDEIGAVSRLTPDQSAQSFAPDGRVVRSGYLTKKGKNFGGWKVRFFVLDGLNLKYYETPGGPHLGTIKLQGAQIGKQTPKSDKQSHKGDNQPLKGDNQSPVPCSTGDDNDNQYRHAFMILEPKRRDSTSHVKHILCAEDDVERDSWIDALMQWIETRDTEGTDSHAAKPATHDRPNQESTGANKLKKSLQARTAPQQAGESDGLIGVRYDSTNAGDAPQHGTSAARPNAAPGLPEQPSLQNLGDTPTTSTPKVISAPKDLHLISDASMWGNRLGPLQPSAEDKKQRKRSFFGFGPKTRSSSDGQESLAGSESGSAIVSQGPTYHVGHVFGSSLAEAVQFHPPRDVDVPLPSVIYRCIQYLEAHNALNEEGIFRLSGSNTVIKQIRERFNHESDINLITDENYYDIHAVASLLKLYLRELPSTILTRDLHLDFLNTTEITDRDEKIAIMAHLVQRLPEANLTLLKYLISFLIRIINNSAVNKMTVRNVGIVFSPTLNIPAPVFATFLQNFEGIFGIDPEEYELPTASATEAVQMTHAGRSSRSDGPSRQETAPRPSTSSGSASSPHRQARVEAVRGPSRSTPTPPLSQSRIPARQSPTPSTGSTRPAYEPAHLAQQNAGKVSGAAVQRPAYEYNHGLEQAGGTGARPPAAYDRAVFQPPNGPGSSSNLAPNERGNKRRESSVYASSGGSNSRSLY